MAIEWRFDQGRLEYFQFDEIKQIARALTRLDNALKPRADSDDFLRMELSRYTFRPFAPENYTVWRNYKRVFGLQMLAADVDNRIVCTDICKLLATSDEIDTDGYLLHFANHFYYPSPVFNGYSKSGKQIFPVVAIVKLLLAQYLSKGKQSIDVASIGAYLIGNQVTGLESLDFYSNLKTKDFSGKESRQLRELVIFISQFSFLKWQYPNLYLDVVGLEEVKKIEEFLQPVLFERNANKELEILTIGSSYKDMMPSLSELKNINIQDVEFIEGNKVRVTHLRTERSLKLRDFYFASTMDAHVCDMCRLDTKNSYPWVDRLIEVHHLLPLSSSVKVGVKQTSLADVVGICPSCHRATHKYYSYWLKDKGIKDFRDSDEARLVYIEAKKKVVST